MWPETALSTFPRVRVHGPLFVFLSRSATRNNLFIIQSVFLHRTHVCNENNRNGFIGEPAELKRHLGIDPARPAVDPTLKSIGFINYSTKISTRAAV